MASLTSSNLARLLNDRVFELTIIPTESCNFRCVYCYENHSDNRLKKNVIKSIKSLIELRISEIDQLNIGWFGGEPLLARNTIIEISNFIVDLTQSYPNVKYRAAMATNGYLLTPSLFSKLVSLGINHYQITLDGPREIHNKSRMTINGKGSYDKIWKNLSDIKNSAEQFHITIRLHFSPSRIQYIYRLIDDLRLTFVEDKRFSFHFKTVDRLGGKNDNELDVCTDAEAQTHIRSFKDKLYGHYVDEEEQPYVCYASRPNKLLVYPNGDIGKCTVALYDSRNRIGSINEDGTVNMDLSLLKKWMRGFTPIDLSTLRCPFKNFPKNGL